MILVYYYNHTYLENSRPKFSPTPTWRKVPLCNLHQAAESWKEENDMEIFKVHLHLPAPSFPD